MSTKLEEHYVVVGEPEEFYLTHFAPENGKDVTLAKHLHDILSGTTLEQNMKITGCDGTSVNTGTSNECIANLERHHGRLLQWVVCLLHCNELPLRRVFSVIDGNTTSPDSFSGPIRREIGSAVSEWPIANF